MSLEEELEYLMNLALWEKRTKGQFFEITLENLEQHIIAYFQEKDNED